jgi:hypothetical protein
MAGRFVSKGRRVRGDGIMAMARPLRARCENADILQERDRKGHLATGPDEDYGRGSDAEQIKD